MVLKDTTNVWNAFSKAFQGARYLRAVLFLCIFWCGNRVEGEDVLKAGEVEWGSKATALGISLGGIIFLGPYLGSEDFMTTAIAASAPPLAQVSQIFWLGYFLVFLKFLFCMCCHSSWI